MILELLISPYSLNPVNMNNTKRSEHHFMIPISKLKCLSFVDYNPI